MPERRAPLFDSLLHVFVVLDLLRTAVIYLAAFVLCLVWISTTGGSVQLVGVGLLTLCLILAIWTARRAWRSATGPADEPPGEPERIPASLDWLLVVLVLAFISAWIWWRSASEPVVGGLAIVGAALIVVLTGAAISRLRP